MSKTRFALIFVIGVVAWAADVAAQPSEYTYRGYSNCYGRSCQGGRNSSESWYKPPRYGTHPRQDRDPEYRWRFEDKSYQRGQSRCNYYGGGCR